MHLFFSKCSTKWIFVKTARLSLLVCIMVSTVSDSGLCSLRASLYDVNNCNLVIFIPIFYSIGRYDKIMLIQVLSIIRLDNVKHCWYCSRSRMSNNGKISHKSSCTVERFPPSSTTANICLHRNRLLRRKIISYISYKNIPLQ